MSNARKVFAVAVLVALMWAVAPVAEAQAPIRIGASVAQTGAFAAPGQNQLRGYQLCVKHMNERGRVLGRKLELVVYDDGFDPATAIRLYEKLITQDKVDLVLGPYSTFITDAVADVTEKHKMTMVAPSATGTSIFRKGRKFMFSMNPPAEVYLEGLIDLAAKKGLKTVALINADGHPARRVSGRPEAPRHHSQDGPQHHLRRIPGRSGCGPDRAQEGAVPVAGRQEGDRLARGAGAQHAALPDAAVESAPVSSVDRLYVA